MKPHPRIRKTIKWGGAAVTVLLVVVWVGSRWGGAWYYGKQFHASVGGGRFQLDYYSNGAPFVATGFSAGIDEWPIGPRFELCGFFRFNPTAWVVWMSILPLAAVPGAASLCAWRLDTLARRRAKLNPCAKCGYDRTGISKDAKCPECGAVPAGV
jgi:hypothetical protein